MTFPTPNCLAKDQSLDGLHSVEDFASIEIRFCRHEDDGCGGTSVECCDPASATLMTIYGINAFGESIAIHDSELSSEGLAEISAIASKLFQIAKNQQPEAQL